MRKFRHKAVVWGAAGCAGVISFLLTGCAPAEESRSAESNQPPEQTLSIELNHPLKPQEPAREYQVNPVLDSDGIPRGYAMRLITDVCLDQTCDILYVTVYWDLLGRYERFEYPPSRPLTKMNHEPFSEEDYALLDRILANRSSALKTYSIEWFMDQASDDVDAVSGATAANVGSEIVEGAVYTSWVLWHWVNGEAPDLLRALTWASLPDERVNDWLRRGDPELVEYVLEMLKKNGAEPNGKIHESLLIALQKADYRTAKNILRYLQETSADTEALSRQLAERVGGAEDLPQREMMDYLSRQDGLSSDVLDALSGQLTTMSYAGVHLALNLFERADHLSSDAKLNVRKLMESDNPFIVRRAKEYLEKNGST